MELSKQVVSLEIAKKLKELGVKQESLFWWRSNAGTQGRLGEPYYIADNVVGYTDYFSAFTVAELGGMMEVGDYSFRTGDGDYVCYSLKDNGAYHQMYADTEADARGLMLIHLLEQGLLTQTK